MWRPRRIRGRQRRPFLGSPGRIDPVTLQRKSPRCLRGADGAPDWRIFWPGTCTRFHGPQHPRKTRVTTDNGRNYISAFERFPAPPPSTPIDQEKNAPTINPPLHGGRRRGPPRNKGPRAVFRNLVQGPKPVEPAKGRQSGRKEGGPRGQRLKTMWRPGGTAIRFLSPREARPGQARGQDRHQKRSCPSRGLASRQQGHRVIKGLHGEPSPGPHALRGGAPGGPSKTQPGARGETGDTYGARRPSPGFFQKIRRPSTGETFDGQATHPAHTLHAINTPTRRPTPPSRKGDREMVDLQA
ncbi:hypothetical protein GWK47_031664 [Chionoecetes opilio]|uniref:Uncharacterized protein n=1 Tax=Chionoecetes opilio TaxID=41210 RepID=A0A8J4YKD8_CHIOP|nr:hypothetical protein GWK47_031664 [Chionoecetes opilio]